MDSKSVYTLVNTYFDSSTHGTLLKRHSIEKEGVRPAKTQQNNGGDTSFLSNILFNLLLIDFTGALGPPLVAAFGSSSSVENGSSNGSPTRSSVVFANSFSIFIILISSS